MWIKDKFFKYSIGTLLVLLIIFFGRVDYVFEPIKKFIAVLFFPIIVAGLFYYLMRPLVKLLEKIRISKTIAILLVSIFVITLLAIIGTYAGSIITQQLSQLNTNLPDIIRAGQDKVFELANNRNLSWLISNKTMDQISSSLHNIVPLIIGNIFGAFSTLANIAAVLIMVPFILFFFLRDDHIFEKRILEVVPLKYREDAHSILDEADKTLSVYIRGQAILAIVLGILMYIGYRIIGLQYPLILALFATLTAFIPYFGSAIGIIPAALIGLSQGPFTVVKILIIMVAVQQLEGNLISPFLVGKQLDIHPLVIILLFLVAASFYGFVGMLVCVPVYAVLKIVAKSLLKIYKLRKAKNV